MLSANSRYGVCWNPNRANEYSVSQRSRLSWRYAYVRRNTRLPVRSLNRLVSRPMSGVRRKEIRSERLPKTLMRVREAPNSLRWTELLAASVTVGSTVYVKSGKISTPSRIHGGWSPVVAPVVVVTCAEAAAADHKTPTSAKPTGARRMRNLITAYSPAGSV